MSKKLFGVCAVAGLALAAAPASAAPVTFTLVGQFDGTVNGSAFTNQQLTITAKGDTANRQSIPGLVDTFVYALNSLTAFDGTTTYVADPSQNLSFGIEPDLSPLSVFGFPLPPALAGFGTATAPYVRFVTPVGYDGTTSLGATAVSYFGNDPLLGGPLGSFDGLNFSAAGITGGTNLIFSAFVSGVPESSTWALMMLGFGGVGAAMRRRKVSVSFA